MGPSVDPHARHLVETTRSALSAGLSEIRNGTRFSNLGAAITRVAHSAGYQIPEDLVGHGIHQHFHTLPIVRHVPDPDDESVMRTGMIFTVEPILVEKSTKMKMWKDNWTLVTADDGWTAQKEHTVLVLDHGVEILTLSD